MRVVFVSMETSHRRPTGGNRRVERVAEHLAERGHEVRVLCTRFWDGGDLHVENGVGYRALTDEPSPLAFGLRLPTLLVGLGPDVVHATPSPPGVVVAAGTGARLAGAPLLVEWFGDEDVDESRFLDRAVRRPDRNVTPSEMVRTAVRELGVPEGSTTVIPEPIDYDLLESVDPADDAPDVVYTHPLDETANAESLLLGLAELRGHDWSAAVVGDGPARESYAEQAADLGIDDRVSFVGEQPIDRRVALYRGAHVFVQTAYRASFATELLWALASGCVGIVEYQAESSAHELVENHPRGSRVTDPEGIADAIADARSFERIDYDDTCEAYDRETVIEQYVSHYRALQDSRTEL